MTVVDARIDHLAVARDFASAPELWPMAPRFNPAQRWYHRLAVAPEYEVWLLTWLPGQGTDLHDHGGSAGAFQVCAGTLTEDTVADVLPAAAVAADTLPAGAIAADTLPAGAVAADALPTGGVAPDTPPGGAIPAAALPAGVVAGDTRATGPVAAAALPAGAVAADAFSAGPPRISGRELGEGAGRRFGSRHIHRITNRSTGPAISIHVYGPALTAMTRYRIGPGGLDVVAVERAGVQW